ncbi:hypothetical protein AABM38_17940 [Heyndrickxia sp. MSNUG]
MCVVPIDVIGTNEENLQYTNTRTGTIKKGLFNVQIVAYGNIL